MRIVQWFRCMRDVFEIHASPSFDCPAHQRILLEFFWVHPIDTPCPEASRMADSGARSGAEESERPISAAAPTGGEFTARPDEQAAAPAEAPPFRNAHGAPQEAAAVNADRIAREVAEVAQEAHSGSEPQTDPGSDEVSMLRMHAHVSSACIGHCY